MKARSWLAATVLGALLSPAALRAEGLEGRFSIAFQGGTQSELSGDLIKGATGTYADKPVTFETKRYRDVYAPDLRLQGVVGYGISTRVEIIARGSYYKAEGTALQVGTFNEKQMFAFFDPYGAYEEAGVEAGLRLYIAAAGRLKSYVGAVGGARFLSETLISLSIPEAASSISNVPFNAKSTVPVFGLDLGFTVDLGDNFFVGVETGLRYQGAPSPLEGLAGFPQFNDSDGKWSSPVVASVGLRF